ncbi:MAG TPA: hypothetical protein VGM39_13565 [Kofleriaceae bacterium]
MRHALALFATLLAACGDDGSHAGPTDAAISDSRPADAPPDAPPPPRQLGLEVNQPTGLDQGTEIDLVKPYGVGVVQLTFPWNVLEPDGNGFNADAVNLLAFGMSYYAQHGVKVILSVPVVDTVANLVPSDLANKKLDDAMVITRAQALVTKVLEQCHAELAYLVLSNEVDVNLADGSPTWSELNTLMGVMDVKARALRPDVKTGVSVTASALLSHNAIAIAALEAHDVAFVTYYNAGNFGSTTNAGVTADIASIVGATAKPIVFKEFGYATGSAAGGSETGQQTFVHDAFAAWDAHAARVPLLMFSRMFDGNHDACVQEAADYGLPNDEAFISFLCTLGLRTYADAAKPAWADFTAAASARTFVQ